MDFEERIRRLEKAIFGYSYDEEQDKAFQIEYDHALRELLKGNREPLKELKEKYGDLTRRKKIK